MELAVTGINHSTANISLRERVAFPPAIVTGALQQAIGLPDVNEAVIVSTCNRTEVYLGFTGARARGGSWSRKEPPGGIGSRSNGWRVSTA